MGCEEGFIVELWSWETRKPICVCLQCTQPASLCFKHSVSNTMHCATMFALAAYLVGTPADFGMCHIVSLSRAHWGVLRGFTFIRVTALNPHSGVFVCVNKIGCMYARLVWASSSEVDPQIIESSTKWNIASARVAQPGGKVTMLVEAKY